MLIDPSDPRYPAPVTIEAARRGRIWYNSVARPGDRMLDVARRLEMRVADVSAIRNGRKAAPRRE